MRVRRSLFCLLFAFLAVSTTPAYPGHAGTHRAASTASQFAFHSTSHVHAYSSAVIQSGHQSAAGLALAVDGAKTPESIPDEMAYLLFYRTLATSLARRPQLVDGVLRKVGLASADRNALVAALTPVAATMETAAKQLQVSLQTASEGRQSERHAVETARATLKGTLSATGLAQLDTYVRTRVKPRTRVYSGSMTGGPR